LGLTSGIIDARNLAGAQVIDVPLQIGNGQLAVTLFLGTGVYGVHTTIQVAQNSSIVGLPIGNLINATSTNGITTYSPATILRADNNSQQWAVVVLGDGASLHDVVIDGNGMNGGTVQSAFATTLLVNNATHVAVSDVTVMNSNGHGIVVRDVDVVGGN